MTLRFEDLAGKRVAILGLGREGQAVFRQLRKRFPGQAISLFAESESDGGFSQQLDPELDHCHFGPFDRDQLSSFDVLVRSAGISPYREVLTQLRAQGVRFTTASSLWFAQYPDAKTICITGTKGKSTTAALTAHLINCAGSRACLSGNIGRPMLDCDPDGVDWWVIELSSYQLSDLQARPDIAVLLNLSEEHIDWHGSVQQYRADKLRLAGLVAHQGLIANASDAVLVKSLIDMSARSGLARPVIWFNAATGWRAGQQSVCFIPADGPADGTADGTADGSTAALKIQAPASLPGEHNMQNLAAALTVLETIGLQCADIQSALASFAGLPHRLQTIGQINGISYVDDSISTTPVSVLAALKTLGSSGVVLLLGGLDRGLGWDEFANKLGAHMPHAIITMPDNGPVIYRAIEKAIERTTGQMTGGAGTTGAARGEISVKPPGGLHAVENLQQAVALARTLVPANGSILLSPGAPSFPHFRDFEDRGKQFAGFAGIEKVT